MGYRDHCDRLLADNQRLTKMLNHLRSSLDIWQQKCHTIEAAFDLSQKLVQHLKTENQLLRSTSPDMFPMPTGLTVDTHIEPISDQTLNNDKVADVIIGCENRPLTETTTSDQLSLMSVEVPKTDENATQEICKSDLIAIEYENEIKELREDWQLLSLMDTHEVVITHEDQINAKSHLTESSDTEEEEENCNKLSNDSKMEIDLDVQSEANQSEVSEKEPQKCKYCGRKFTHQSALDDHKLLHKTLIGTQIRCAEDECGYQFDSKRDLHRHLKTVHKNHGKPVYSQLMAKFKSPIQPKCNECDKLFPSNDELRTHQKTWHNIKSTFKCKFSGCDKTFEKPSELRAHEVIHRKQKSKIGIIIR